MMVSFAIQNLFSFMRSHLLFVHLMSIPTEFCSESPATCKLCSLHSPLSGYPVFFLVLIHLDFSAEREIKNKFHSTCSYLVCLRLLYFFQCLLLVCLSMTYVAVRVWVSVWVLNSIVLVSIFVFL